MRQIKKPSSESFHVVRYGDNLVGVFVLGTRVIYPMEVKIQAIQMRLAGIPRRQVIDQLGIRNMTHRRTTIIFLFTDNTISQNPYFVHMSKGFVKPLLHLSSNKMLHIFISALFEKKIR